MRNFLLPAILLIAVVTQAQEVNIIPNPSSLQIKKGNFIINKLTPIVVQDEGDRKSADFLNSYLKRFYGFQLVIKKQVAKNSIRIYTKKFIKAPDKDAYTIESRSTGVTIEGDTYDGTFYGIQTLVQLLPLQRSSSLKIASISVQDQPRFKYRGMHLDVSRHFFPVSYIKTYIDYIALHKMNYFHWHLTDDQGWRIEIKKYPKLTEVGAWRDGTIIGRYPGTGNDSIRYGGFYTQDEIKEVVAYAAKRYITIIPEIEMPGHSMAALAAYPQLGTTPDSGYTVSQTWGINDRFNNVLNPSEYTFNFLQDVLDEVMQLFPAPYIHIGGDECSKRWWHESAFCQQLMKEKGIKDEHALQSYFIQRIEKYVNSKGKKIIGWDEILEGGLAPNATVMSWRGEQGGIDAAKQDHDVIMTPGNPVYFDHTQSQNEDSVTIGGYNPLEKVYAYEPIPKELNDEQAKHVLGAQGNVWTEYMAYPSKIEYMIFPRMSALSEVLWSPKKNRDWKDFEKRLMGQFKRYDLWKANYSKAYFDLKATVTPSKNFDGVIWSVSNGHDNGALIFRHFEEFEGIDTQDVYTTSHPANFIQFEVHKSPWWIIKKQCFSCTTDQIFINKSGQYSVTNFKLLSYTDDDMFLDSNYPITKLEQEFHFNKATGKKITLTNPPSKSYPGDGAFTLVNGVINEKGFARSSEFLGFNGTNGGTNCEAIIDLGPFQTITSVTVHVFERQSSWIWRPLSMEAFTSDDGQYFSSLGKTDTLIVTNAGNGTMTVKGTNTGRFVKVLVKNRGEIPAGNPGAGNKAWLFVDEIEIN